MFLKNILKTEQIIRYSVLLFLLSEIFGGPIRYYFPAHGLAWAVYVPKVELIAAALILLLRSEISTIWFFAGLAVFIVYCLIGLSDLPAAAQAPFALWTMVPLLFSMVASSHLFRHFDKFGFMFQVLYGCVIGGVVLNFFHNVPWSGSGFALAGQHVVASRSWTSLGFQRIGGFGRASFSAASQALVLTIFITHGLQRKLIKAAIWLVTGIAVVVTTSKGVILAYIVLVFYYLARFAAIRSGRMVTQIYLFNFNMFMSLAFFAMIAVPISSAFIRYQINVNSYIARLVFLSSQQRLSVTWPNALSQLKTTAAVLFGNGLGGMGAAQQYFDLTDYNAGDNLFVYLTVQYGCLISLIVLFLFFGKFLRVSQRNTARPGDLIFVGLSIFLIVYGFFLNELEEGILSFAFGLCLSYARASHATATQKMTEATRPSLASPAIS
jgi:hypothetical protein